MQETINERKIKKGQIAQIITDKEDETKLVLNIKIINYNKETGRIMGYKIGNRTVGDPEGKTKHLIITHKDEIRAWLSN